MERDDSQGRVKTDDRLLSFRCCFQYGKKRVRRNYSRVQTSVELPNLIEVQTGSFQWLIDTGLKELFKEIFGADILEKEFDMDMYKGGAYIEMIDNKVYILELSWECDTLNLKILEDIKNNLTN